MSLHIHNEGLDLSETANHKGKPKLSNAAKTISVVIGSLLTLVSLFNFIIDPFFLNGLYIGNPGALFSIFLGFFTVILIWLLVIFMWKIKLVSAIIWVLYSVGFLLHLIYLIKRLVIWEPLAFPHSRLVYHLGIFFSIFSIICGTFLSIVLFHSWRTQPKTHTH